MMLVVFCRGWGAGKGLDVRPCLPCCCTITNFYCINYGYILCKSINMGIILEFRVATVTINL